jgi:hypothetical protein
MHPLQIWMYLLRICKISKTDPDQPTNKFVTQYCIHSLSLLNHHGWKPLIFQSVCTYKTFCALLYRVHCVIQFLILQFVRGRFYAYAYVIYIYYVYNRALCVCINVCTYMHLHWKLLHPLCSWSGYRPVVNTGTWGFILCAHCSVPFQLQSPWPVSTRGLPCDCHCWHPYEENY